MTEHQKAILKALIDLDGRGTNKQIYELAKKYAVYNGQTPNNTIRRDLQQTPFVRPVEGTVGVWEIIPFNKIVETQAIMIAELEGKVDKERQKVMRLKEELQDANSFARLAVLYMKEDMDKSQEKREEIKYKLLDMACELSVVIPHDVNNLIKQFDNVVPPEKQILKIYNAGSHSADIELPGLSIDKQVDLVQKKIEGK